MTLAEHPTVRRFREANRPDNAEPPKPLDAAWLRQRCLDCGAFTEHQLSSVLCILCALCGSKF